MTNNYRTTRTNMPRANYGRNATSGRQASMQGGGSKPGTYSGNTNAAAGSGMSTGFFPSGYVYSSQNSANPTGYFYGNMPQSEQHDPSSKSVGSFNNSSANTGRSELGQPAGYRSTQQRGQSGGMNARNNFNAVQGMATRQNGQNAVAGNRVASTLGVQNRAAGMQNAQNRTVAPPTGGVFGGIGGMVKGILGEDPLGSIGKVVNIMKMLV